MARSRKLGYGEGSIYQQGDGRWRGELRLGTKRRRVSAWTRSEVVAKLDELPRESSAGLPLGTDMRLGEWLDWYQEMIEAEKHPSTCANCAWAVKQLTPLRGRRLRELEVLEFEALLKDLANRAPGAAAKKGRGGREKPLSKSSLNRIKMVLGAALHEAERRGLVARNIARLAHLPPGATGSQGAALAHGRGSQSVRRRRPGHRGRSPRSRSLDDGTTPRRSHRAVLGRGGLRRGRPHRPPGPQTPSRRLLRHRATKSR